jgi:hypothetical protein
MPAREIGSATQSLWLRTELALLVERGRTLSTSVVPVNE